MNRVQLTRTRPEVARRSFIKEESRKEKGPSSPSLEGGGGPSLSRGGRKPSLSESTESSQSGLTTLDIERQALDMTKAERQALLDRLSLSLLESGDHREISMWVVAVQRALQARLSPSDESAYGPAILKGILGAGKAFGPISAFMKDAGMADLSVPDRQAALNYLAELVVADAADFASYSRIPLGAKLVGTRQTNVRGIFERAFPSYLASGLAKHVFRRYASARSWDGDRSIAS